MSVLKVNLAYREVPLDIKKALDSHLLFPSDSVVHTNLPIRYYLEQLWSRNYYQAEISGPYDDAVSFACLSTLYGLYKLSCLTDPVKTLSLGKGTTIVLVVNDDAVFCCMYNKVKDSYYFSPSGGESKYMFNKKTISIHEGSVRVVRKSNVLGENVIGGIWVSSVNNREEYTKLVNRQESRFSRSVGEVYGVLCHIIGE